MLTTFSLISFHYPNFFVFDWTEDDYDFPTIDIDPLLKADEDVSQCEKSIRSGMQEVQSNFQQN